MAATGRHSDEGSARALGFSCNSSTDPLPSPRTQNVGRTRSAEGRQAPGAVFWTRGHGLRNISLNDLMKEKKCISHHRRVRVKGLERRVVLLDGS